MARFPLRVVVAVCLGCVSLVAIELTELEDGSTAKLTGLGNIEMAQGRYETAINFYKQALGVDRAYFTALYNLGLAYQHLGDREQATQWYREALRVSPDHPEVLNNLGWLAWQGGDAANAADRFVEAARLSARIPADAADFWFNAGCARERLGATEDAQRAYQECLALSGDHVGGHYNLGTLYLTGLAGRPGAARQAAAHLGRATELDPTRADAWLNLARARERLGQDARSDYDRALDAAQGVGERTVINRVRWQRALAFSRRTPPDKLGMRDELLVLIASDPDYPDANGLLGGYYFDIADFDHAVNHLEREVAVRQGEGPSGIELDSWYRLAVIFTDHQPNPARALAAAQEYYRSRPDSPKIHELRRRALRLSAASSAGSEDRAMSPKMDGAKAHAAPGHDAAKPVSGHAADDHGTSAPGSGGHAAAPAASHAAPPAAAGHH